MVNYSERVNETLPDVESLTPRQLEIVELVSQGFCNDEIMDRLVITEETVKSHIRSIEKKFGLVPKTPANWKYHTRVKTAIVFLEWSMRRRPRPLYI